MIPTTKAFKFFIVLVFVSKSILTHAQFTSSTTKTFNSAGSFIENKGQYGITYKGQEAMGKILYGFEGHDMPILFTKKGMIILQRKVESISNKEKEKLEKQGITEEEIEHRKIVTEQAITMEWLGANNDVEVLQEEKTYDYHTYGLIQEKAYGFQKIIYKNLYNGIDLIYSFTNNSKIGFEYSLQVPVAADISQIKMLYGGDIKKIKVNKQGSLIIYSDIEGVQQNIPITYYTENNLHQTKTEKLEIKNEIATTYRITNNTVSFLLKDGYDNTKSLIIDPFISSTSTLDGVNAGKAKDIDFDYEGNVYVTGGGNAITNHRLVKYNANGVLQWTFNGILTVPTWQFGGNMGGWVVDKISGNIYLGQGLILPSGARIIRLSNSGIYDNYISTASGIFQENWKMLWNCNNGNPQILIGGGGGNSNINLGVLSPPNTDVDILNITGIPAMPPFSGIAQDIADILIDPLDNKMYTIFGTSFSNPLNNKIYCNANPYSASSILWNTASGFNSLFEGRNRPYLATGNFGFNDNSANIFALNSSYLFYWDGKNLSAYNKSTGAVAGSLTLNSNIAKMSGGILADPLNNIYIGNINGTITSYTFNGISFIPNGSNGDPNLPEDIFINAFSTNSVYDLAYNEAASKIYACGDGFVASYNIGTFGSTTTYTLNITPNCTTLSAIATLTPTPPLGSVVAFALFIGTTQITSNTSGNFTNIIPFTNYTVVATLNAACSGTQTSKNFILNTATVAATSNNEICGNGAGQIIAIGSGTTAPYTYSINGVNFFPSGIFTGLSSNTYAVTVKDGNNCISPPLDVIVTNTSGVTVTARSDSSTCGFANGKITATRVGGTANFEYSNDNGLTYQAVNNNVFINLSASAIPYKIKVRDGNNCVSPAFEILLGNKPSATLTATSVNATCGYQNGKIMAFPNGQYPPFLYSINGGSSYQNSSSFANLAPIPYDVLIKDNNNCVTSLPITIAAIPIPILNVFAGNDTVVVIRQPLQLNAIDVNNIGFVSYVWSPSSGLNRSDIKNPTSILEKDYAYEVIATTADGCLAKDSIKIKISFKSEIYVPTGFTPNGDGLNDLLRPKLIGVKSLKYFVVYNRYGEVIYKSNKENEGWDGKIKGSQQASGTYVWMAEAIDYNGQIIFRKGMIILIL